MTEQPKLTRRRFQDAIVGKALADPAFRRELAQDARSAVEKMYAALQPDAKWPATLQVQAFEEPQDCFYIVIPHVKTPELTDEELERVAGGAMEGVGVELTISGSIP